ncbi:hypothetical protein jhhlp_008117 [Lomentospora prolificans]|uniref:F-box domain-containing protein n=1 Tax=Lomentospora prolificans TaxID=41688 RepID=A0A2N3MZJ2_9PEZI|nr:hypothetical protein jhhlp_008117 [Lomentospora prolificans]
MPPDLALRPARDRLAAFLQSVFSTLHSGDVASDDEDDGEDLEAAATGLSDDDAEADGDGDDVDDVTTISSSSSLSSSTSEESLSIPVLPDPPRRAHTSVSRRDSRARKSKSLAALPSFSNSGLQKYRPGLRTGPGSSRSASRTQSSLNITDLPIELQVLIISELDFADVQQLRLSNRFYHSLITKSLLRDIYGVTLEGVILSHCHLCLRRNPSRNALLYADITHPKYPFCSRCVDCAVRRNELTPGCRVSMGNFRSAWVCRWCGYPVLLSSAWNHPDFHKRCYSWYGSTLLAYLALGWIQFCIVIVGAALCLRYFKSDKRVLIPCILSLLMAFVPLILINMRRPMTDRTYHWSLGFELTLLGLWIAPTYAISSTITSPDFNVTQSTIATLAFCGLNLLFRLFNTLGNLILLSEFKFWRRKKPDLPLTHRFINCVVAGLVFWTYPRAIEQSYTPHRTKSSWSK